MKEEIRTEIIYDLDKALRILQEREATDVEELKNLSDHAIEDIALKKDLELVSVTVLLYSLYKIIHDIDTSSYMGIVAEMKAAKNGLEQKNLGKYNQSIKKVYEIIRRCDNKIREHLDDVMQAARIKKGTSLLQRGLSIGQAAGLMGLSNWDLQQYAGKTMVLDQHDETFPVEKRVMMALKLFGMS